MAVELLGPGVDAEAEVVTEEELSFSVSFFVGGAILSMMNQARGCVADLGVGLAKKSEQLQKMRKE